MLSIRKMKQILVVCILLKLFFLEWMLIKKCLIFWVIFDRILIGFRLIPALRSLLQYLGVSTLYFFLPSFLLPPFALIKWLTIDHYILIRLTHCIFWVVKAESFIMRVISFFHFIVSFILYQVIKMHCTFYIFNILNIPLIVLKLALYSFMLTCHFS